MRNLDERETFLARAWRDQLRRMPLASQVFSDIEIFHRELAGTLAATFLAGSIETPSKLVEEILDAARRGADLRAATYPRSES